MGPPDRKSWLLGEHYPTGTARGWRRTGCVLALVAALLIVAAVLLAVAVAALL